MRHFQKRVTYFLVLTFTIHTLCPATALAEHFFGRLSRMVKETAYHGTPPTTCKDGCVEQLAENIDWLEHHIDTYGSIVAKQPDIWGEARLTKHRDEYEQQLHQELNQFKFKLNAAIAQADSSFLSQALALSAAAKDVTMPTVTTASSDSTASTGSVNAKLKGTAAASAPTFANFANVTPAGEGEIDIEPTLYLDQLSRYLQHLQELRRINEGDDTSDSPGYALNLVRIPISTLPGKLTRTGFGAEVTITATPTLSDDLLPTTFRNLVINDLVDQLGLPLVRTVENVELVRKRDEIQQSIKNFEILKTSFLGWNYFDNDANKQEVSTLIDPVLDDPIVRDAIEETIDNIYVLPSKAAFQSIALALEDHNLIDHVTNKYGKTILGTPEYAVYQFAYFLDRLRRFRHVNDPSDLISAKLALRNAIISFGQQDAYAMTVYENLQKITKPVPTDQDLLDVANTFPAYRNIRPNEVSTLRNIYEQRDTLMEGFEFLFGKLENESDPILSELNQQIRAGITSQAFSTAGRARRARHPLPPSQVVDVYGSDLFVTCSDFFCPIYSGRQVRWNGDPKCQPCGDSAEPRVNLLDAQKWLRAELASAHDLLNQPHHLRLWYQLANPQSGLAAAIRSGHLQVNNQLALSNAPESPAYEFLETPESDQVLGLAPPTSDAAVEQFRDYFFQQLHQPHFSTENSRSNSVLTQLAWVIVVESALLNARLNEDIRKTFTAKGQQCMGYGDEDLSFFLPEAAAKPESGLSDQFVTAAQAFQEYVRLRWPIHVFALDPREQDQNVADVSARKREMQFALALGFTNGKIGANSLTQFSRDMQTRVDTISLNRTAVGFSHNHDTFGWRFFPRVQALHVPGTFGAIKETLCGVSRDDDLKKRQLEPGMRECVAIVLMPSFVPSADFDIRTNWFKLTNPKNTALTMKDTVHYSRAITSMRNLQPQCYKCSHHYRAGEVHRLMNRVDQLDRELPLQTMRAQIPYENTLGGFEMFNTGVTDLSPELIGWHGAPGIVIGGNENSYTCGCKAVCAATDATQAVQTHEATQHPVSTSGVAKQAPLPVCDGAGTTLFLVGDNFSVHDTKIIAGGVCIPHVRLISREIMRVTIPSCVNTVKIDGEDYVAIYAATPYGVTNHLHVPVHCRSGSGSKQFQCPEASPATPATETDTPTPAATEPDATTWRLIPLPEVRPTITFAAAMHDEPLLTEEQLNTIATKAAQETLQGVKPNEIIVNVQSTSTLPPIIYDDLPRRQHESGPLTTQFKTKMGECFRNLRDTLPGY